MTATYLRWRLSNEEGWRRRWEDGDGSAEENQEESGKKKILALTSCPAVSKRERHG